MRIFSSCLLIVVATANVANAQWTDDLQTPVELTNPQNSQAFPQVSPCPDGGFWLASYIYSGGEYIRVQRFDSKGRRLLGADGLSLGPPPPVGVDNGSHRIFTDREGCAVISWISTESRVIAHRISPRGELLWGPMGVEFGNRLGSNREVEIAELSSGDIAFVWEEIVGQAPRVIRYQRVSPSGQRRFSVEGMPIRTSALGDTCRYPNIVAGNHNTAIVTWAKGQFAADVGFEYTHVAPTGVPLWVNPRVLYRRNPVDLPYDQDFVSDGNGGAVLVWTELNSSRGGQGEIYLQHLDANGNELLVHEGVQVSQRALGYHYEPVAMFNPANGNIVVAWSTRSALYSDFAWSAQGVTQSGVLAWGRLGVPLSPLSNVETRHSMMAQAGGEIYVGAYVRPHTTFIDEMWVTRLSSSGHTGIESVISGQAIQANGTLGNDYLASSSSTLSLIAGGKVSFALDAGSSLPIGITPYLDHRPEQHQG